MYIEVKKNEILNNHQVGISYIHYTIKQNHLTNQILTHRICLKQKKNTKNISNPGFLNS